MQASWRCWQVPRSSRGTYASAGGWPAGGAGAGLGSCKAGGAGTGRDAGGGSVGGACTEVAVACDVGRGSDDA